MLKLLMLLTLFPQISRDIPWDRIEKNGFLLKGKIEKGKKYPKVLKVKGDGEMVTIPLFFIEPPAVRTRFYQLKGEVKYRGVVGRGYLEMISHFKGGRRYFTRTLGGSGLLKSIEGDSPWRKFALPFSLAPDGPFPIRLTVNMVFFGKGEVWISPMKLADGHEIPSHIIESRKAHKKPWWNEKTGGWIGGLWGSFIGLFGALAAFLYMKDKGKLFIMAFSIVLVILGIGGTTLGLIAWLKSQPHNVYFPISMAGALSLVFGIGFLVSAWQRKKEREEKKMRSKDL